MSTTLNRPTEPGTSAPSPPSFRTLARVVLRLHRGPLLTWVAVVVLVGAGLVWLRWVGVSVVLPGPLECWDGTGCGPQEVEADSGTWSILVFWLGWISVLLTGLPVAVAAWAGAALTGAEQERGTAALAWTQSVSPRRWVAVKWAVAGGVLVTGVSMLVPLYVWARSVPFLTQSGTYDWTEWVVFTASGPVTPALLLLALTLGAYAGLLLRRSLAALAVSAGTMFGAVQGLPQLIPYLWPAERAFGGLGEGVPSGAWRVSETALDAQGRPVPMGECLLDESAFRQCADAKGIEGVETLYHPVSHAIPLHLTETALILVLTAALAFAALRLLRRRTP
ncbi:ABC transporter [Streptomyces albidoflavus]|uniref:ABC transporter n=1 Tax=Streptomyces albidoflavus TaxID=1886 RepID=UPI00340E3798